MELPGGMHEPVGYGRVFCRILISRGTSGKNYGFSVPVSLQYWKILAASPADILLRFNPAPGSMSHHEAFEHHEHPGSSAPCRVCSSAVDPKHKATMSGICHHCVYKILIIVFIVMIAISYVAWFGVL
jgi:hypothetical protein